MAEPQTERAPEVEASDVHPGRIALVGGGGLAFIALLVLVPWGLIALLELGAAPRPATAVERAIQAPPEPRLHPQPGHALEEVRSRARRRLESYGWVDREAGLARIPIDAAMAILAERGVWPETAAGEGAADNGPDGGMPETAR